MVEVQKSWWKDLCVFIYLFTGNEEAAETKAHPSDPGAVWSQEWAAGVCGLELIGTVWSDHLGQLMFVVTWPFWPSIGAVPEWFYSSSTL